MDSLLQGRTRPRTHKAALIIAIVAVRRRRYKEVLVGTLFPKELPDAPSFTPRDSPRDSVHAALPHVGVAWG